MQDKTVLISGAGIAGPTLAWWLARSGFRPTLVEHAPQLRTGGYIIDFWGMGYDIAERMGLLPALREAAYAIEQLVLVDARGRRIGGFDVDVFSRLTHGRFLNLARGDLASAIYRATEGECETVFGDTITGIAQDRDGVRVAFLRGSERTFDLVVGADSLHSTVRRLAIDNHTHTGCTRHLGYMVAAFEAGGYRPRDERSYVSYSVPGKQVSRFAMRDDRTVFLFVFAADRVLPIEMHDRMAQRAALHAQFGEVGWECPHILAALDRCDDIYFDAVSQISLPRWSRGRTVLLGDAAFCPSLLAGQGSALAMIAAYVLAGELGKRGATIESALRDYEALLRPFMERKQAAARRFARSFAPRSAFGVFLRNQITKAFALPGVARLAMGNSLMDRLTLPDYDWPQRTA